MAQAPRNLTCDNTQAAGQLPIAPRSHQQPVEVGWQEAHAHAAAAGPVALRQLPALEGQRPQRGGRWGGLPGQLQQGRLWQDTQHTATRVGGRKEAHTVHGAWVLEGCKCLRVLGGQHMQLLPHAQWMPKQAPLKLFRTSAEAGQQTSKHSRGYVEYIPGSSHMMSACCILWDVTHLSTQIQDADAGYSIPECDSDIFTGCLPSQPWSRRGNNQ
jgi:hypothetical protein